MQLTHLGPYEIGKPLGKGGMGSVYAAVDTQTGQRVAIKALTPHLAMAEGFRERFEAEIESLKTLRHEGIVRLYGYGEQDGVLFYSMELVEGISLEDELKAGRRFNWREVTSIAIQLSLALKHAHDHGIVHRDIKPANILLSGDEHVKLADFGIARLFGTTQLTTAGGVLGTADYMSPEQAEGRPVTARCDQYSLGGVMYALLAGRPPFLGQEPAADAAAAAIRQAGAGAALRAGHAGATRASDRAAAGEGPGRAVSEHASARAASAGDGHGIRVLDADDALAVVLIALGRPAVSPRVAAAPDD